MDNYYLIEFERAIVNTRENGLKVPDIKLEGGKTYINELFKSSFPELVYECFPDTRSSDLHGNCIQAHKRLLRQIEKTNRIPVIYTIGYLKWGDKFYHQFDNSWVQDSLRTGFKSDKIPVHTWLTLPTMEIIDLTFFTSYSIKSRDEDYKGIVNMGDTRDILSQKKMMYFPVLIGEDFFKRTGEYFYK